ncbi:hypothetical protein NTE_00094 [Candidatus Nitrososphaera evergladensis SR1]|uniref:Uncharacterized protein n=1 Tax=Candidatus Nitrososphaera evergladensis SR1 TaxID=1459636 RepID=A0A075MLM4_9ARCH|nr:hypothetical protein [Candidatus Nitrososphaera evergladensis]AIF82178.1 hypothetical protein NTE_00094 [Candidatus Nitrososphaera evergladensis SR1]
MKKQNIAQYNDTHRSVVAFLLLAVAATIIAAAAYPEYSLVNLQRLAAGEMMLPDSNNVVIVKFTSLSAYDSNHNYLGNIKDNMTFRFGEPVFLQANFTNSKSPSGNNNYLAIIEVRNSNTSETMVFSSVQTEKFAEAGNLAIGTYWKPDQKASYTILVFLLQKPEDLNKTPIQPPISSVRVQVA